jgi:hypothetical protein
MAETKHKYIVRLEAENGKVVTASLESLGTTGERSFKKIEDGATRVDTSLNVLTRSIVTRFLPAISAAGLARAAQQAVGSLGDLADASERLGVSAESLQVFRLIGQDIGVGAAAADGALQTFTKRVGEAQAGVGKLLPVLEDYNIAVTDSQGRNRTAAEIYGDLADVIARTGDAQEQLRIASAGGLDDFVAALRKGRDGLGEYEAKFRSLGLVVTEEVVQKADEFDKAWDRALLQWSVAFKNAVVNIGSLLDGLIDKIRGIRLTPGPFADDAAAFLKRNARLTPGLLAPKGVRDALGPERFGPDTPDAADLRARYDEEEKLLAAFRSRNIAAERKARDESAKSREDSVRIAARENEQIEKTIQALKFRNEQMGRTNEEQELYNQLRAAGVTIDSEAGRIIAEQVDVYNDMAEAQEANNRATEAWKRGIDDLITNFDNLGDVGLRVLSDLLQGMIDLSGGEKPSASIGGFFAESLFGAFSKPEQFGPFLPGRAAGGPVMPYQDYIVGERGPEILRMGAMGGTVIPNGASAGGGMTIHYLDARGADREGLAQLESSLRQLNARVDSVNRSIDSRAVAAVQDEHGRSTSYLRG